MYGSKSRYGEELRADPLGRPIIISDYPGSGDQTLVHLGTLPEWVLDANHPGEAFRRHF